MRLVVSSLSPHNLHLLFYCVIYSCFDMIGSYSIVSCCYQETFSFSLEVSLLSHINVFLCDISFISGLKRPQSCFSFHFCFLFFVGLLVLMLSVWFLEAVISLRSRFLCSLQVVVLMRQHCLQYWLVLFLLLFLIHIIHQRHLWDVMPYAWR